MPLNSSVPKSNVAFMSGPKKGPRLDFSLLEPKHWYKYSADQTKTGKKCVFKDACPPKPIYALGHTSSSRRAAPKFVPARRLKPLTDSSDIARKVKDKIEYGEIKPLFLVGPTKGPRDFSLNTFENLFGGSIESAAGSNSMPCIQKVETVNPSRRSQENAKTKSRFLYGSQSEEDQQPTRTGLRIVPNKCRDESDYWVTTFKRLPSEDDGTFSQENSFSGRIAIRDDMMEKSRCDTVRSESRQSHREFPSEGTKSISTLVSCQADNNVVSGVISGVNSGGSSARQLQLGLAPMADASEPAWPKKGNLKTILEQLMEEDQRPAQPSDLPIYLQGLKRSENGWYRRIRSTQISKQQSLDKELDD